MTQIILYIVASIVLQNPNLNSPWIKNTNSLGPEKELRTEMEEWRGVIEPQVNIPHSSEFTLRQDLSQKVKVSLWIEPNDSLPRHDTNGNTHLPAAQLYQSPNTTQDFVLVLRESETLKTKPIATRETVEIITFIRHRWKIQRYGWVTYSENRREARLGEVPCLLSRITLDLSEKGQIQNLLNEHKNFLCSVNFRDQE